MVKNKKDELISQRIVTGWRMCIDYKNLTRKQRKITSHYPSSMRCWNGLQSILSFVSLMGILAIIKSRSILMTKAKLLLLVPMEHMLIAECVSDYATL